MDDHTPQAREPRKAAGPTAGADDHGPGSQTADQTIRTDHRTHAARDRNARDRSAGPRASRIGLTDFASI